MAFPGVKEKIYLLDSGRINYYWDGIVGVLESIPGFSDLYTTDWVYSEAKKGHLQLWAQSDGIIRGILVTRICEFPKAKVFEILAAGGVGMLDFFEDTEAVFEWVAKDNDCDFIRAVVRPGLERKLRHKGGVRVGVILTRKVDKLSRAN